MINQYKSNAIILQFFGIIHKQPVILWYVILGTSYGVEEKMLPWWSNVIILNWLYISPVSPYTSPSSPHWVLRLRALRIRPPSQRRTLWSAGRWWGASDAWTVPKSTEDYRKTGERNGEWEWVKQKNPLRYLSSYVALPPAPTTSALTTKTSKWP